MLGYLLSTTTTCSGGNDEKEENERRSQAFPGPKGQALHRGMLGDPGAEGRDDRVVRLDPDATAGSRCLREDGLQGVRHAPRRVRPREASPAEEEEQRVRADDAVRRHRRSAADGGRYRHPSHHRWRAGGGIAAVAPGAAVPTGAADSRLIL